MTFSRATCAAMFLMLTATAGGYQGIAANPPTPAEVEARRQEILADMLTESYRPALIANARRSCALGEEPASVAESRADGAYFTPDASDACVTALVRTARDRHLPELYRVLLPELGGISDGYEKLPRAIGAAALGGMTKVAIGNGKAAVITPALALDAGFTVAYQDGSAAKAGTADATQLKGLTEACLGQRQDPATCFSVGYVHGAGAFKARTAAAN